MKLDPSEISAGFEPLTNAERQIRKRRKQGIMPRPTKEQAQTALAEKTRDELIAAGWQEVTLSSGETYWSKTP